MVNTAFQSLYLEIQLFTCCSDIIDMLYRLMMLLVAEETASELTPDDKSSKQTVENKRSTLSASSKEQLVEFLEIIRLCRRCVSSLLVLVEFGVPSVS